LIRHLPTRDLRFELSCSDFDLRFQPDSDATLLPQPFDDAYSPQNQVSLRSSINLTPRLTLDTLAGYVDSLDGLDVDSYVRFDARIAYKLTDRLEVSRTALNLAEVHEELAGQPQLRGRRYPGRHSSC